MAEGAGGAHGGAMDQIVASCTAIRRPWRFLRSGRPADVEGVGYARPCRGVALIIAAALVGTACGAGDPGVRAIGDGRSTEVLGMVIERDPTTTPTPSASIAGVTDRESEIARRPAPAKDPAPPPRPSNPIQAGSSTSPDSATSSRDPSGCDARDVDCDGWWWDPEPSPNQPLVWTVSVTPEDPVEDQAIEIVVRIADPDAQVEAPYFCITDADGMHYIHGDVKIDGSCILYPDCVERKEGPVAPPAVVPSEGEWLYRYTPVGPGTVHIEIDVRSVAAEDVCHPDPYASYGHESRQVTF